MFSINFDRNLCIGEINRAEMNRLAPSEKVWKSGRYNLYWSPFHSVRESFYEQQISEALNGLSAGIQLE